MQHCRKITFDGVAKTKTAIRFFQLKCFRQRRGQGVGGAAPGMQFDQVLVLAEALSVIRAESRNVRRVETGGPLVGYVSEKNSLIVTNGTGPGPKAKLERYSVTIDGEHAQRFCDRMRLLSHGRIDYVGDWHRHPGLSLNPSEHDVSAMRTMAAFEYSPTRHPISLIYRRCPEAFKIYVWDTSGSLVKISARTEYSDFAER
jgi:integrative and conjugative element protein (TIGR02256 family)